MCVIKVIELEAKNKQVYAAWRKLKKRTFPAIKQDAKMMTEIMQEQYEEVRTIHQNLSKNPLNNLC